MKTKIIYISGNEVFDMADIRAAFEEVRCALNLDKDTVLFGVPVDTDDAGLTSHEQPQNIVEEPQPEIIEETPEEIIEEEKEEPVVKQPKKRGRSHKEEASVEETVEEDIEEPQENPAVQEEKVIPILSVLSNQDSDEEPQPEEEIEIISEISEEEPTENIVEEEQIEDSVEEDEADLEKLLSAMTPLQEDILETKEEDLQPIEPIAEPEEDVSVDATLEQLATEFAETQDKIATEKKSTSRSKIGKLRNILPFKQSKHKDQGLGDLFGWAGVAANDEDFSVPGFFTNAASKN